jgi:cytochrome P450
MNLRRTTSPQTILGRNIPRGVFVACSPVVTARDERCFVEGDKFLPQRWLTSNPGDGSISNEGESTDMGGIKLDGDSKVRVPGLSGIFDENEVKRVHRLGSSVQFGKGQHACLGEKLGRMMVLEILWDAILGSEDGGDERKGFDIEILEGLREGVGVDGVGVEANWARENLGTPFELGGPVLVRFHRRS